MSSAKMRLEGQRTDEFLHKRTEMLVRRKELRANNALARQSVSQRIEKMRQTSTFDIDEDMRSCIQNPELLELLERCHERTNGSDKVPLDTMSLVLGEMQSEGKLVSGKHGDDDS